jgi:quinol monooxygenase YgiN
MNELKTEAATVTTIVPGQPICTMINTLTVKPEKQEALLAYLKKMTEEDVVISPGFISANFHVSEDGTRVINYAQWRSIEDLQAMLARHPEHVQECRALAQNIEIRTDLKVAYCAHVSGNTQE